MRCALQLIVLAGSFLTTSTLAGQELRIFTVTRDVTQASEKPGERAPIVSRSLTLFHAGKVYDYIDILREVTIFEPAHRRFTILNESAAAFSIVSQDEVRQFLSLAETRARELAGDLLRQDTGDQRNSVEFLQFQLRPEFKTSYDSATRRLRLETASFGYDVVCVTPPQATIQEPYLRYADAMAELNAVLHPQSLLPAPRLELNRQLRNQGVLPISVRRSMSFGQRQELIAEHEWKGALTELDRQLISGWESQLTKGQVRELTFEQLQRAVLTGKLVSQR